MFWGSAERGVGDGKGEVRRGGRGEGVHVYQRPQWTFTGKRNALYWGKVEKGEGKRGLEGEQQGGGVERRKGSRRVKERLSKECRERKEERE